LQLPPFQLKLGCFLNYDLLLLLQSNE